MTAATATFEPTEQTLLLETGHPRRWLVLPVLLTGLFLLPLDFAVVNVALPSIRVGLGASASQLQLIIAAYAVTYAVFLITGGRLGDLYGRKAMFIGGLAAFMAASAACGFAPTIHVLIAGRMVQGVAAAMVAPQVLATIRVIFPVAERNRAIGYYGATIGLALVLGQLVGGLLIGLHPFGFEWESIFLINLPIGGLDLLAALWLLPVGTRTRHVKLDIIGVVVLSAALLLLIYPLVAGRETGWPAWTLISMALSVPAFVLFVRLEQRLTRIGGEPLLDIRLFRDRAFSVGLVLTLMVYSSSAYFFSYAVYLQSGLGWSVLAAGLGTLPFSAAFFFGTFAVPSLVRRFGLGAPAMGYVLGILGQSIVVAMLLNGMGPGVPMLAAMAVAGFGLGLVFPSLIQIVLKDVPAHYAGMASGALNTAIQVGPAFAVPIIGGVFLTALGTAEGPAAFAHAFAAALMGVVGTFAVSLGLLSLLRRPRQDA